MKRTVAMEQAVVFGVEGFRWPEPLHYQEETWMKILTLWPSLGDSPTSP
jgi:hypothetical protein